MIDFISMVFETNGEPFESHDPEFVKGALAAVLPFEVLSILTNPKTTAKVIQNLTTTLVNPQYGEMPPQLRNIVLDVILNKSDFEARLQVRDQYFEHHQLFLPAFLKYNVRISFEQYKDLSFTAPTDHTELLRQEINESWLGDNKVSAAFAHACEYGLTTLHPEQLLELAKKHIQYLKKLTDAPELFLGQYFHHSTLTGFDQLYRVFKHLKFTKGVRWITQTTKQALSAVGIADLTKLGAVNKANRETILKLAPLWQCSSRLGITVSDELERRLSVIAVQATIGQDWAQKDFINLAGRLFSQVAAVRELQHTYQDADHKKMQEMLNTPIYDYLSEYYFKQYSLMIPCTLEAFRAEYPTLYSLTVLMPASDKCLAWIFKEMGMDSAVGLYLEHSQQFKFVSFYNCENAESLDTIGRPRTNDVKVPISAHLCYLIGHAYNFFSAQCYRHIALNRSGLKDMLSVIYPQLTYAKHDKGWKGSFDVPSYLNDPCSSNLYLRIYAHGGGAADVMHLKPTFECRAKVLGGLAEGLMAFEKNGAGARSVQRFIKLYKDAPATVSSGDWIPSMCSELLHSKGAKHLLPTSFAGLLKEWLSIQTFNKDLALLSMNNEIEVSRSTERVTSLKNLVLLFNKASKHAPKTHSNLPDIRYQKGKVKAYILPPGDARALIIGIMTGCCQHIVGSASAVAISSYTEPDQGVFVVETETGQILAQSLVWTGAMDNKPSKQFKAPNHNGKVIVFDSVESRFMSLMDHPDAAQSIIDAYANAFKLMQAEGYAVAVYRSGDDHAKSICNEANIKTVTIELECDTFSKLGYSDFDMEKAAMICV